MEETDPSPLGSLVRQYRQRHGISQEELAERVGGKLSVNTISNIERGRTRPYRQTLDLLSSALELDAPERAAMLAAWHRPPRHRQAEDRPPVATSVPPLAIPLTPMVGREQDLAVVTHLLLREDVRLVTLTGAGGVGKTRLAQEVVADVADAFRDGVVTLSLAALRDPTLVLPTVAQALGVPDTGSERLLDRLSVQIRDKSLLLFLDNVEQVAGAGSELVEFLARCVGVTALVTSRMPLHVRGEHEVALAPLALPQPNDALDLDVLGRTPAVALFVQRVRAVCRDFDLTAENADAVAAICARLDGLPLAIELAAARSKLFPPRILLQRLARRLDVLTGGPKDLPARQRTLRETLEWSYDLLSPEERTLFARLSVFAGGWTFEAAEAVANPESELDLLDAMTGLAEKSLLRREELLGDVEEEPRFRMLETVQEFAAEQLAVGEEEPVLHRRHADYFLALTMAAEGRLRRWDQTVWLARLEREHDNLRAGLTWTLAAGEANMALQLAGGLGWFWRTRGYIHEGQRWLESALDLGSAAPDHLRAKAMNVLGSLLMRSAMEQAARCYGEALALWRRLGDAGGIITALFGLGGLTLLRGDLPTAERVYAESLSRAREAGLVWETTGALRNLAVTLEAQGKSAEAKPLAEEALARFQELGDPQAVGRTKTALGEIAYDLGDFVAAGVYLNSALAELRELDDWEGIATAQLLLGKIACAHGDYDRALTCVRESFSRVWEARQIRMVGEALELMAWIARGLGHPSCACRLLGASDAWNERNELSRYVPAKIAYDQEAAALRLILGDEAFRAAYLEGRSLQLEDLLNQVFLLA